MRAALARLRRRLRDRQGQRSRRRRPAPTSRSRPIAASSPPRSSSTRSAGAACWPAATATSRPTRRSHAGSRSIRAAAARTSRSGSTAATCPPATAGPSRPRTSCGSGSAPSTPDSTSRTRRSLLTEDLGKEPNEYQGNWIPHKLRRATEGGVFFVGDSAGHCLPLTAEGIRTALYFGIALGRELRGVVAGHQGREAAAVRYAEFNDSHERRFRWMLRVQRLHSQGAAPPARAADPPYEAASASSTGRSATTCGSRRPARRLRASFAGLAVARELTGTDANVLVLDRYEIGERADLRLRDPYRLAARRST